jgi:hypothetical protein
MCDVMEVMEVSEVSEVLASVSEFEHMAKLFARNIT